MNTPVRTKHRRSRGTAMIETVLALPFIMLILLFLVYFGRASTRIQRSQVMDRYQAWRDAGHGPGPSADEPRGNPHLNDAFFDHSADSISHGRSNDFPDDAAQQWITYAGEFSDQTASLAQAMFDNFAKGQTDNFSTTHSTGNRLLARFAGPVRHGHTVLDHHWKFVNGVPRGGQAWDQRGPGTSILGSLRDIYYEDFDDSLEGMADNGNPFARMMRGLYLHEPGYRGPEVP